LVSLTEQEYEDLDEKTAPYYFIIEGWVYDWSKKEQYFWRNRW
jgi:hypothetical protein